MPVDTNTVLTRIGDGRKAHGPIGSLHGKD